MFFEKIMNAYWSKKAGNKKGFTLVEMLVVVAIIAALVSVIIPAVGTYTTKAAAATNAANLRAAKGEFTTMKLLNPEDYKSWTGGVKALTGVSATNEKFYVTGTAGGTDSDLTVTAKNAVAMKTTDITISADTNMNAQIIKDENNAEEVYVTYAGLPIAYFAEVAEFGYADPNYYLNGDGKKGAGNLEANQAYIEKYKDRVDSMLGGMKTADDNSLLPLYGSIIKQMNNISSNLDGQGDCLKCAMNNVNILDSGSAIIEAGQLVYGEQIDQKLKEVGYNYTGAWDKKTNTIDKSKAVYCTAYNPVKGIACACGHGPDSHISTTEALDIGEGMTSCPEGGVHTYDGTKSSATERHTCTKCNTVLNEACPSPVQGIPYLDAVLATEGECKYCGYCACCAKTGTREYKTGLFSKTTVPAGYHMPTVKGFAVDSGVCASINASDKGCGHPLSSHGK